MKIIIKIFSDLAQKEGMLVKMNKKICWPRVLKNISYVLFPIFLTILVLLIVCLSYPLERHAIKEGLDYYETNTFAENYALEIFSSLNAVTFLKDNSENNIFSYEYISFANDFAVYCLVSLFSVLVILTTVSAVNNPDDFSSIDATLFSNSTV